MSLNFILASESKIRKKILSDGGFVFKSEKPLIDEEILKKRNQKLSPVDLSLFLAKEKALSVSKIFPKDFVIGCDQVCLFGNRILSKPIFKEKAIENLKDLSGKEHHQISGLAIAKENKIIFENHYCATLKMKKLSVKEIEEYVDEDNPLLCSGSYKFESHGKDLFEYIKGDPYVIQGIALEAVKNFFK